jgi:hypothetical protein
MGMGGVGSALQSKVFSYPSATRHAILHSNLSAHGITKDQEVISIIQQYGRCSLYEHEGNIHGAERRIELYPGAYVFRICISNTMGSQKVPGNGKNIINLNLVLCIPLRVLDQVQGFPSKATLFQ